MPPPSTISSFSPLILIVIFPEGENFAYKKSKIDTSERITSKKTTIALNNVVELNNIIL